MADTYTYTNEEIAKMFEKMAKLMEYHGMNKNTDFFRLRAYQNAAQNIKNFPYSIAELYFNQELKEVPGVGEDLLNKIKQLFETGTIEKYEELKNGLPESILELFEIPGVGPKQTRLFFEELGIKTVQELEEFIKDSPQKLMQLPRMGEQKINQIMQGVQLYKSSKERVPIGFLYPYAQKLREQISGFEEVEITQIAGSLRRMKETIGDIDILVTTKDPYKTNKNIGEIENIREIIAQGETKTSVFLKNPPIQVDIRYIEKNSFGAALQYFTGSQSHNIKLRMIAKQKGMKLSEYGIFQKEDKILGEKEEEIYNKLGLDFVPPEIREDNGEIEKAKQGKLPQLIGYDSIKGDLHIHSDWSDGIEDSEKIVEEARRLGYEYVGITDHSQSLWVANGLEEERVKEKVEKLQQLKEKYSDIKILIGTECDILSDGSLDYTDEILQKFDLVIASIHQGFSGNATQRYIRAMENPFVNIIGHPTTRKFGVKEEMNANREEIFKTALEKNIAMEVNSQPDRLDFKDKYVRQFVSMGGKISINTDAHTNESMQQILIYGIGQARRGWAEEKDVINARDYQELIDFLNKKQGN